MRQRHFSSNDGVATMGNVSKWTAMHKGRGILRSLHQVRLEGIFQEHHDATCNAEVAHAERRTIIAITEEDIFDATTEISLIGCQAENRHQFASGSDVKSGLRLNTVRSRSKTCNDLTKRTIIDIKHTAPQHFFESETFSTMLIDIVIEQSRNHIVR